jgi:hypothetical protein
MLRDRLDIPNVTPKITSFRGKASWAKMIWGPVNLTGMPPNQKVNKAE